MAIRDHFRLDLLVAQAARLQAVDAELAADERARSLQRAGAAGNCPTCGALYGRGAAFCSQCGTHLLAGAGSQRPAQRQMPQPPAQAQETRTAAPGAVQPPAAAAATAAAAANAVARPARRAGRSE